MQPLSPKTQEWVRRWLRKADGDLRAGGKPAEPAEFSPEVAFRCQQAAGKHFEARLAAEEREPPRTHDLEKLLYLAADFDAITSDDERLVTALTPRAVLARYPANEDEDEPGVSEWLGAARHFRDRLRPLLAQASAAGPYPAN